MVTSHLTDRQRQVLNWIIDYLENHGYPPTIREMGVGLGMSSMATVHRHLQILVEKGYLVIEPGSPRAIRIVAA